MLRNLLNLPGLCFGGVFGVQKNPASKFLTRFPCKKPRRFTERGQHKKVHAKIHDRIGLPRMKPSRRMLCRVTLLRKPFPSPIKATPSKLSFYAIGWCALDDTIRKPQIQSSECSNVLLKCAAQSHRGLDAQSTSISNSTNRSDSNLGKDESVDHRRGQRKGATDFFVRIFLSFSLSAPTD